MKYLLIKTRLKLKLKMYRKHEKYYKEMVGDTNWYTETGIPNLEKQIRELEQGI